MRNLKILFVVVLIWPNLCFADSHQYFKESIREMQKGFNVVPKGNTIGILSIEDTNKMINHFKKALEYSYKVTDEDLKKLDNSLFYKTLPDKYENLFRSAVKLYIEAWEGGGPMKGMEAVQLFRKWDKYFRKKFNVDQGAF